jgi:hypothetical protein
MTFRFAARLRLEVLEERRLLSVTTFIPQRIAGMSLVSHDELVGRVAAELDGDGDKDVIGGFRNKIAWFENVDGQGMLTLADDGRGLLDPVTPDFPFSEKVYAIAGADLDGDGDLDLVSADKIQRQLLWYENTDGSGRFSAARRIDPSNANEPGGLSIAVKVVDLDLDGDVDVVSAYVNDANDHSIVWFSNDGNGVFGPATAISTNHAESLRGISFGRNRPPALCCERPFNLF